MSKVKMSVSDLFRRAQALRRENPKLSYKDFKARLVDEFKGNEFPSVHTLTIPEQDAHAPEEDWSAGLPLVMRGIQTKSWREVADGIALSLEQTENYAAARGGAIPEWHDRTAGIREPLAKGVGKWMPEDLMSVAERAAKK